MGINLRDSKSALANRESPLDGWRRSFSGMPATSRLRIHTLGRFSITLDNHPIRPSHASHQRPLELLKALLAFGGRGVHADILSHALWPDADGDKARNAFDVTLHRLRNLLELRELLITRDQQLTLNNTLAWVDVWEFERLVNHSEQLLNRPTAPAASRQLARCEERLLTLYQGAFLEREATRPWAITLRERLRSKLLRHMLDAGRVWESAGEWDRAIRYYRKGLELDPLIETFYQRLMICLRESGRNGDALAMFHQCRKVFAINFQASPSRQTLDLYATLKR